ncbi:hypothetical protein V8E36_001640 [Tilletia maclaganii]
MRKAGVQSVVIMLLFSRCLDARSVEIRVHDLLIHSYDLESRQNMELARRSPGELFWTALAGLNVLLGLGAGWPTPDEAVKRTFYGSCARFTSCVHRRIGRLLILSAGTDACAHRCPHSNSAGEKQLLLRFITLAAWHGTGPHSVKSRIATTSRK